MSFKLISTLFLSLFSLPISSSSLSFLSTSSNFPSSSTSSSSPSTLSSSFTSSSSAISATTSTTGYYTSTIYKGVTCGNLKGKESYVYQQTGTSFGSCEVGYDAYGVPISSGIYTLDCSKLSGGNFQGTFTLYADLECKSKPVSTSTWTKAGKCSTSGEYTTNYTCVTGTNNPPYNSLSKGDLTA